jgi:hypothetical protein
MMSDLISWQRIFCSPFLVLYDWIQLSTKDVVCINCAVWIHDENSPEIETCILLKWYVGGHLISIWDAPSLDISEFGNIRPIITRSFDSVRSITSSSLKTAQR